MQQHRIKSRWIRLLACFLIGVFAQSLWVIPLSSPAKAQADGGACAVINPLSPEEMGYAQSAWNYFVDNTQPATGLTNSAGGYPSGTLWDMGNYLTAMNAARWMGIIDQTEFDGRLNQFLAGLSQLRLFEDTLPNKVYNSATGDIVDYGNNVLEKGIGWSALDIGRMLAAFHIIRTCHPQYGDWLQGIVDSWQVAQSVRDGMLYGAAVTPDGETMPVQEGRLGYEEYAARGYELWGFHAPNAISYEPFRFENIYGLDIPVDTRDYQSTNANNYVVSESYILDAIEFGLQGDQADYAWRVFEAQRRRFEDTGILTAVSEDNINQAPYFLYSTVFSNGVHWAVITETNELHPELRTLSTKAAFGWHYVYPDDPYAQLIFDKVKDTANTGRGYIAGIYEHSLNSPTPVLNDILTGNTNGLLVEIMFYKARGYQPIIGGDQVTASSGSVDTAPPIENVPEAPPNSSSENELPPPPVEIAVAPPPEPVPQPTPEPQSTPEPQPTPEPSPEPQPVSSGTTGNAISIAAIPPVGAPKSGQCPVPNTALSVTDERYARNAWKYFQANYHATGLVDDRSDMRGATLWGLGDYLAALHASYTLKTIDHKLFDQRVRHLLGALREMPLFAGELPNRAYNTLNLDPIDYGGNRQPDGNGWSGLDVGRMLAALHTLKTCHPEYTEAVDAVALDWSYLRVARNGRLGRANFETDERGRDRIRVHPSNLLGYEEYAARGFQLWGFDMYQAAAGGDYETADIEGEAIPVKRKNSRGPQEEILNTTSTPFIVYGLEYGFDPIMKDHIRAIFEAEAKRYERTGIFSASGTTLVILDPYIIHSTLVSNGKPWQALTQSGASGSEYRMVSTAVAFAYHTLFPNHPYSQALWQATLDLYNPVLGYYEGFFEDSRDTAIGFSGGTNSLILQALLHKNTQHQPIAQAPHSFNSTWWEMVRQGDTGQGLPENASLPIELITGQENSYWVTAEEHQNHINQTAAAENQNRIVQTSSIDIPEPDHPASVLASNRDPPNRDTPLAVNPQASQALSPLSATDMKVAKTAWTYLENNWNESTGLINAVNKYPWGTLWDYGSSILGLHAAHQLGIVPETDFQQRINILLTTLQTMPLPATGLPNKAYSSETAEMRTLNNKPDPQGKSGWSVLDLGRYLVSLKILKVHYPQYASRIDTIVQRYQLNKLEQDGWLIGTGQNDQGTLTHWQEGRLGYEQYAAHCLKLWEIDASNALHNPPTQSVTVDGIELTADQRNLSNSGASNFLTNDPYILWGLELGWTSKAQQEALQLLKVQKQRFTQQGILTAVNEDSIDRAPHFLYYSIYANDRPWTAISSGGRSYPQYKFLSTKAAFGWSVLAPNNEYTQQLRNNVQTLGDTKHGYFAGRYEDPELGPNRVFNINTNAIILESLLYQARGYRPLIEF